MNTNPIFSEYYSHLHCQCYKVRNPWTAFREQVVVLCPVEEGLERAKILARGVLALEIEHALNAPVESAKP